MKLEEKDFSIMDLLPQFIGSIDASLHSRFVNAAYAAFLGKSKEELSGASMEDLWGQDVALEVMPFLERALKGEKLSFTKRIKMADGEIRIGKVRLVPSPEGGFVSIITDQGEFERNVQERGNLIHELDHRVNNILQVLHSSIALEIQAADDQALRILEALKSRLDALALSYEFLKYPEARNGRPAAAILEKIAAAVGPGISAIAEADPDIFISPGDLDAFIFIASELARWATVDGAIVTIEARRRPEGIELSVGNGRDEDLTIRAGSAGLALVESFAESRRAGPLRGGSRLSIIFPNSADAPASE
jgi:PAS domain S-box-containing protein